MATFNAGTVQADVEIDRTKLQGSVNGAIQDIRRLGTEGGAAGNDAGTATGEGYVRGMDGRLRDIRGRFVAEIRAAGAPAASAAGDIGDDAGRRAATGISDGGREGGQGFIDKLKNAMNGGGLEGALDAVKDKLKDLVTSGAGIGALAGAGIGLALATGLMVAINLEPARAKLSAQLGLTATESARMGGVAGQLYAHAYGESFEEVTGAIRLVVQNIDGMRNASAADLQAITGQVMSLSQAFDQDLGQTTRAVGQMIKTGLAKDATEALDIIAVGFQKGADKSEDFLDTLNEYGTQFRKLGITGQEATGLITQGLQAGARDADIVADAFKEFAIRAIDGSKLTSDSLTALGVNARAVSSAVAGGGIQAANATDLVLDKLRAVEDPAQRAAIAVGLFGTQSEDLGEALFALDLSKAAGDLGEVAGAAARVDEAMGSTAQGGLTSIGRGLQLLAEDIGTALLPVIKFVITGILDLMGAFGTVTGVISEIPGPLLLAVGGLTAWWTIAVVAGPITTALGGAFTFAAGAASRLWAALGPIGIIAIAATTAMSFLMDTTDETADVAQAAGDRWDRLVGTLDSVSGAVTDATRAQLAQEAQSSGMLSTLKELGVSTEAYVSASAGVTGAQEELGASVQAAAQKILSQSSAFQAVAVDMVRAGVSQQEFITAMESGDLSGVTAKVNAYAEAQGRATGSVDVTRGIQDRFNAAVAEGQDPLLALGGILNQSGADAQGFSDAANAAAERAEALGQGADGAGTGVDGLGNKAAEAADPIAEMKAALDGASAASAALDQATQYLALTLDLASGGMISQEQASRANEAALRGIGGAQRDVADAYSNLSDKQAALTELQTSGTATAGELEAANRDVASAADAVFDAQDAQSQANIQVQQTAIAQAVALASTAAANGSLKGATDIATTSLQRSKDAFIAAQPEADRLTGKAQATAEALFGVPSAVATRLTETGAINVQTAAQQTTTKVGEIPDYHNTDIRSSGATAGTFDNIGSAIRNIPTSWQTVITTVQQTVTSAVQGILSEDGNHLHAADGLITGRGISQRRMGAGGGVTWAEGITGEEFYISMKHGQEIRNRGFLSQAAQKLGGSVDWSGGSNQGPEPAAAPAPVTGAGSSRTVTVGSVQIGRFDDAERFFDRMAWEQVG